MARVGGSRRRSWRRWSPVSGATQAKGADTLATATLKLLTTLRNADVEPTAALLNPADYEVLRSAVTAQHIAGPPITVDADGQERLFSIPLVVSPRFRMTRRDRRYAGGGGGGVAEVAADLHQREPRVVLRGQLGRGPCRAAGRARCARTGRRRHRHVISAPTSAPPRTGNRTRARARQRAAHLMVPQRNRSRGRQQGPKSAL